MPIVIFLIGIASEQRHHSQVRMHPWTTFFNGDSASNKLTAATLHAETIPLAVSIAHRRASTQDSFLECPARP